MDNGDLRNVLHPGGPDVHDSHLPGSPARRDVAGPGAGSRTRVLIMAVRAQAGQAVHASPASGAVALPGCTTSRGVCGAGTARRADRNVRLPGLKLHTLTPIFTKRIGPPAWVHTRWQLGRGGPVRRGDRTLSRSSSTTTAASILIFFTTKRMGTGYVAIPSTRAVNGGVVREKGEESAGHPPVRQRHAARPDVKAPAQRRCA